MSVLERLDGLASAFGLKPKGGEGRGRAMPPWWSEIGRQAEWGTGMTDPSVYANQARRYVTSPYFHAGVSFIADTAAMAKLAVFDGPGEDAEPIPGHPVLELLKRPAPNMDWLSLDRHTLIESVVASLLVTGNAFVYMGGRASASEPPTLLLPLRTDRMAVRPDREVGVAGYEYRVNDRVFPLGVSDVIHFRLFHPEHDFMGLSKVEPANYPLASYDAAQRHNWAVFKNQLRPSAVVTSDWEHVDPEERKLMEQYILDTFTGEPEKAFKVLFLWAGFKAEPWAQTLKDMEYIEGQKLNRQAILMVLRIHPALLMSEDVNLANARVAEYFYAKYTLLPMLTRVLSRLNAELLPLYGEGHELRALDVVPRDVEQQVRRHRAYLHYNVLTPNEVRRELGMEPVPWGNGPANPQMLLMGGPILSMEQPGIEEAPLDVAKSWDPLAEAAKEHAMAALMLAAGGSDD